MYWSFPALAIAVVKDYFVVSLPMGYGVLEDGQRPVPADEHNAVCGTALIHEGDDIGVARRCR